MEMTQHRMRRSLGETFERRAQADKFMTDVRGSGKSEGAAVETEAGCAMWINQVGLCNRRHRG